MKKSGLIYFAFIFATLLTGCVAQKMQPKPSDLIGTWKTDTIQTEEGKVIIEITFVNASDLEFKLTPVDDPHGQTMASKGQYTLSGGLLTSESIHREGPISVWLEKGELVIQAPGEEPMRFTRSK